MAEMRRFGLADLLVLALVLTAATAARVGYLVRYADGARGEPLRVQEAPPPAADFKPPEGLVRPRPTELDVLIEGIRSERQLKSKAPFAAEEEVTAHVSPAYPWLAGETARLLGPARMDVTLRWLQAALGSLTAVFYFFFARRAFRSLTVGALAGLFAALHPFWVIAVATIDDGVLAGFMLGLSLLLAGLAGENGGPAKCLLLGLTLAALALVRASMLPFAFVALVWFLIRSQSLPQSWLCALLAFLGFGIGLAPWTVRNAQALGEPAPVVSSVWLHLWLGNNPEATGGAATAKMWQTAPADELKEIKQQPARYARLGRPAVDEVRDRPAQALYRRLYAALAFLVGERWLQQKGTLAEELAQDDERPGPGPWYHTALQGSLLGMLLLALLGWRWSYGWRWEVAPATLAVLWVPLPYILSHAEALSGPRLPLDGVLLCFAAFALACLIPGVGGALLRGAGPRAEAPR